MKTYVISIVVAGLLLAAAGFVLGSMYGPKDGGTTAPTASPVHTTPAIDEHGCDVASGFVWCAPTEKCVQLWDEKCEGSVPPSSTPSGKAL